MQKVVLTCEPLSEENFAPFGFLVRDFAKALPRLRVGVVVRNRMRVRRVTQIEWVSAHHDGEQIIVPDGKEPTVFVVAPPSPSPNPNSFRAFFSDGTFGIGLALGAWHAPPIPARHEHALYDNAQGSRWHEHTVEVHLPTELGCVLSVVLP